MDTTQRTAAPTTDELREQYREHTGDNPPRSWVHADLINYLAAVARTADGDDLHSEALHGGDRITAVVTGTNRGVRFFTRRPFVVSRDQTIERAFIPARGDIPAEDRIFVQRSYGSAPELVVSGSIEMDDDDQPELINGEEVGVSVDHYGRPI